MGFVVMEGSVLCIVPLYRISVITFKVESGNEYANNIKIYIYFYDFIPIVCDGVARHRRHMSSLYVHIHSEKGIKELGTGQNRTRVFKYRLMCEI